MNFQITDKECVDYWLEQVNAEIGMRDIEYTKKYCYNFILAKILFHFSIADTGIMAFLVVPDFDGTQSLTEALFYIKPEYRGDLKTVKEYISHLEVCAKELNCKSVKIGANIKYKDNVFMKLLERWGYQMEVATKGV